VRPASAALNSRPACLAAICNKFGLAQGLRAIPA
jgi:hypothetical protein